MAIRCVIHGSLRKHLREMGEAMAAFRAAGIEVVAPELSAITRDEDGFLFFRGEESMDPKVVELLYLSHLRDLGPNGFSYFVDPAGYVGRSVSYELGVAQASGVPCYFLAPPVDHPAFVGERAVWSPAELAGHIKRHGALPRLIDESPTRTHKLWHGLVAPNTVVTTGAIIEHQERPGARRDILLVRTHKWHDRWSVVGGKARRGERLHEALRREVHEETGLEGFVGRHITTFDELAHSGYYDTTVRHLFVDYVVRADRKQVILNDEAQEYAWMPAQIALRDLDLEPNARTTVELYARLNT